MQLKSSDESLASWVGLQSTQSRGSPAAVEGRDMLSAADGSAAVEANADAGVITTWAASASDVDRDFLPRGPKSWLQSLPQTQDSSTLQPGGWALSTS